MWLRKGGKCVSRQAKAINFVPVRNNTFAGICCNGSAGVVDGYK